MIGPDHDDVLDVQCNTRGDGEALRGAGRARWADLRAALDAPPGGLDDDVDEGADLS